MKIVEMWKTTKKKNKLLIVILIIILIILFVLSGGFVIHFFNTSGKEEREQSFDMNRMENGMVTASGTTATDMVSKQLELDSLETALYVEEVYVSSGDSVSEGDKLIKITNDSIEDARKELKQKATQAQVSYNEQKIAYEESVIEARKSADITVVEGEYADSTYSLELANENQNLEDLKEQVAEALELAEEYYAAVNSDYYYAYYGIEELQKNLWEPFAYLSELYDEWNIEDAENAEGMQMVDEITWNQEEYSLYKKFDSAVTNLMHELESAKENYETDTNKANYSLEAAQTDYALLNAQLEQAIATLEETKVRLKAECDIAKAEAELAESSYEATIKQLEEELNKVSDENETAQQALQNFEEMLGDGFLRATESGDILMLNARVGSTLDVNMPYLVYSDSSNVTVTVSVEQTYIADISVGDEANVVIGNLGTYTGKVTSINPISQSDSRSSIYYSVVVTLSGDVSNVTANQTATVIFGEGTQQGHRKAEEGTQQGPGKAEEGTQQGPGKAEEGTQQGPGKEEDKMQ